MLTCRRPFDAEDVSDTLTLVLKGQPDWNALPRLGTADSAALNDGFTCFHHRLAVGSVPDSSRRLATAPKKGNGHSSPSLAESGSLCETEQAPLSGSRHHEG